MLALLALLPAVAAIRGCGGGEIGRRNTGGHAIHARQVDNSNIDVAAQCAPYSYPPTAGLTAKFPVIWQAADLVAGDDAASSLFATINTTVSQKFPNAVPKGNGHLGDFTGVNYGSDDPDCWWTQTRCTTPAADTNIVADISTMPEPDTWGFGFDDGPNCSHNLLYNFLEENNQKATMFFIGSNVMDWPVQAIRAREDGHEICVHTWSHGYMTSFNNQQAFAELYYTREAIKQVVGVTPTCWRPPFGDVDNRIRFIAAQLNLTTILWSDDTFDWSVGTNNVTEQDVINNYNKVFDQQKSGAYATHGPVVLNHEINNFTMQEMINQYPTIKSQFKAIVPIAVGYNNTHPYAEQNYTFPDFNSYISGQTNGTISNDTSSDAAAGGSSTGSAANTSQSGASSTDKAGSGASSLVAPATTAVGALAAFAVGLLL